MSQETNSNTKFKDSKKDLAGWINKLEGVLLGEPVQINYSTVLTNQLEQLKVKILFLLYFSFFIYTYILFNIKEMQKSVNDRRDTLEMVNTLGQEMLEKLNSEIAAERLTEDLQDLNTRWSDIPVLLDERILKLQKGILKRIILNTYLKFNNRCLIICMFLDLILVLELESNFRTLEDLMEQSEDLFNYYNSQSDTPDLKMINV